MFGECSRSRDRRLPDLPDGRARGVDVLPAVAAGGVRVADHPGLVDPQGALPARDDPRRDGGGPARDASAAVLVLVARVAIPIRGTFTGLAAARSRCCSRCWPRSCSAARWSSRSCTRTSGTSRRSSPPRCCRGSSSRPIFFDPDQLAFVQHHPWVGTLLNWVNPVAPFIEGIRSILYYGTAPGWGASLYAPSPRPSRCSLGRAVFRRHGAESWRWSYEQAARRDRPASDATRSFIDPRRQGAGR